MKKRHLFCLALFLLVLVLILLLSGLRLQRSGVTDPLLTATVLKTGKSDAILLRSGGSTMMLDTAEADDAAKVIKYLQEQQITTLDYLVITHFDKDHIGSAAKLLEEFKVGQVLLPDYEGAIAEYADFMSALKTFSITPQYVTASLEFPLGEATVKIDPPINMDVEFLSNTVEDFDNTLSLMTTVTCGEQRMLFTGDADRRRIEEWLDSGAAQVCSFLKVPHHGKYNSALEDLLEQTQPRYAAITCSKKNPANDATIDLLQQYGVDIFQTRDGAITVTTDGTRMDVRLD